MTGLLLAALGAAALGAPHCLGMCGGLAGAGSQGGLLPYQLGRIGTYTALGAFAGLAGRWIPGPSWLATVVSGALLVGMALALGGWLPEPRFTLPGLHRFGALLRGRTGPVAALGLGVLNGLLPCGLLYATLALAVSAGTALGGATVMGVFGLATAIPLTLAVGGLRRFAAERPRVRQGLAALVLVSGLAGLSMRAPSGEVPEDGAPACHHEP